MNEIRKIEDFNKIDLTIYNATLVTALTYGVNAVSAINNLFDICYFDAIKGQLLFYYDQNEDVVYAFSRVEHTDIASFDTEKKLYRVVLTTVKNNNPEIAMAKLSFSISAICFTKNNTYMCANIQGKTYEFKNFNIKNLYVVDDIDSEFNINSIKLLSELD